MISFGDFEKLDLRVGTIVWANEVDGSDKLLKLVVDLGKEKRQLVAGIKQCYEVQDLMGRQVVVVTNLEPKTIFGVESQGMLLAADQKGQPILLKPDHEVPSGTRVR